MDYNSLNKVEILETLQILKKKIRENEKLFLAMRCQLITEEGMIERDNDHLDIIKVVVDIVRSHQEILKGGERCAAEEDICVI